MKSPKALLLAIFFSAALPFSLPAHSQLSPNVHVWVTGLNGPRGLKFGPDGNLYVAEAGTGGTTSTIGQCAQVVGPIGPYTAGTSGRISRIDSAGNRTTVAANFPSAIDQMGDILGVADLSFSNGSLYALEAGGGCSHGSSLPNGVYKVNLANGSWTVAANLSQFLRTHPVAYPNAGDFEPDGTFYSMASSMGRLFAVEPNHGQVISVAADGSMQSVLDVSASEGHIVPTAITARDGQFYLGNLGLFPITPTASRILTLSYAECSRVADLGLTEDSGPRSLHIVASKAGFTTVVSTAFGPDGLLYVLEMSDAAGFPTPGAGKVVRVNQDGAIQDIATGLVVPTAMTFGPNGKLYVSNLGAAPPGAGQIVRIDIP